MNPQLRVRLLLGIFILLIGANIYFRWGSSSLDRALFFGDGATLDTQYSATLTRKMDEIRDSPLLSFRERTAITANDEAERNPFIFGVDRRQEAAQRERLEALAVARQEAMEAATAQPIEEVVVQETAAFKADVIGVFENLANGVRKATLSTEDGLFTVGAGDMIEGRFRVVSVSYQSIQLFDTQQKRDIELRVDPQP